MPRLCLLAAMVTTSVLVVLITGVAWLRQAPVPPANLQAITKGMTIGEVERLVGYPLTCGKTCTSYYYCIVVPTSWADGQSMTLVIDANPYSCDSLTKTIGTLAHDKELCTRVTFQCWSRIDFINRHEWLFHLFALGAR